MKYTVAVLFALVFSFGACNSQQVPADAAPPTSSLPQEDDAGVEEATLCSLAGKNLMVSCPALNKTPAGKSFEDFCKDAQSNGLKLNPRCLATAHSCEEANACIGSH